MIHEHDEQDPLLYDHLVKYGATENELAYLRENPAFPDEYAADFYAMHVHQYTEDGDLAMTPDLEAHGLYELVHDDYWPRLKGHVGRIALGETNLHGTDTDKVTWLKYIAAECERCRQAGIEINELCWYGFIGGRYWSSLLTKPNRKHDDFGICTVKPGTFERWHGLFYDSISDICHGKATFDDLPAYRLQKPLDRKLASFMRLASETYSWQWEEVPPAYRL
jgi:hypothetical protein